MTLMVYVNAELVINILISDFVYVPATRANASGVEVYGGAVYKIKREAVGAALRVLQNRIRNAVYTAPPYPSTPNFVRAQTSFARVDTSAQSAIGVKRKISILVRRKSETVQSLSLQKKLFQMQKLRSSVKLRRLASTRSKIVRLAHHPCHLVLSSGTRVWSV